MDVFRCLTAQLETVKLPLFAVTLTAIPRRNTPVLLMMHWHGFAADNESPRVPGRQPRAVPASALQLNDGWNDLGQLDDAMLDAAWRLGAWELAREARRACSTLGASEHEAFECRQAFGDAPLRGLGETHLVAEASDREEMMHTGARVGYVRWIFRPVRGGLWARTADDDTLLSDGSREPPCPVKPMEDPVRRSGVTRYRLGRIHRLFVP